MENNFTVLTASEARELIALGTPNGLCQITASGKFIQGYRLPNGMHLDHYLNFGHTDKFFLSPEGYMDPTPEFAKRANW